jgi:hypothetical protein
VDPDIGRIDRIEPARFTIRRRFPLSGMHAMGIMVNIETPFNGPIPITAGSTQRSTFKTREGILRQGGHKT